jgi:hypothetical protein
MKGTFLMFNFEHRLEHIFSLTLSLKSPEVIGPLPGGIRAHFYFAGGQIDGPRIHGKIRPEGGDWLTLRSDGVAIIDIRSTIEADDGALISSDFTGVCELGLDGYERFLRRDLPPTVLLRTTPRYLTVHPGYLWLNRLQCVGFGETDLSQQEARLDIYALK